MTEPDAARVLADLPASLWPAIVQAVRKAADALGRNQLPAILQPYAGFAPGRLAQGRAKAAVTAALASDARLREIAGRSLGVPVWEAAATADATILSERFGASPAAAGLAMRDRWGELADLAAQIRRAEQQRPARPEPAIAARGNDEANKATTAALRRETAAAQRRVDAAEQRSASLQAQLDALQRRLADVEQERDTLRRAADEDRNRSRDRVARLQRRISEAESRARADAAGLEHVASELERLAGALRNEGGQVNHGTAPPATAPPATAAPATAAPAVAALPRSVRPATPGRPCVLPPGISADQPAGVTALLRVRGLQVVVDGYNVSKDLRGVPAAGLPEQRAWLQRLVAGAAAGIDARMTIVFDGDRERTSAVAASRIVRTVYTAEDETADERIVAIVDALPGEAPVVVVSSDREVRDACEALGANVVASGVFLQAVS